jgi:hypothetical protein
MLLHIGRFQIELWRCPAYTKVPMHSHPLEHTRLWFIKGTNTTIFKRDKDNSNYREYVLHFPKTLFRNFYLAPEQQHGFTVASTTLYFLNIQWWVKGANVTSASVDFVEQTN